MAGLSEDKYNLMLDDVVPGTDVLFASELGNSKGEAVYPALAAASGGSFITSDPPPPSDPAAGAGIYLSARAKDNILGLPGANGPRICFVRIKTGIANQALFCVAFYCRYWNWGAKKGVPAGHAFLEDMVLLQETLEQAPENDTIVCGGDFNARLAATPKGEKDPLVGRFLPQNTANEAGRHLRQLMGKMNLAAVNSFF